MYEIEKDKKKNTKRKCKMHVEMMKIGLQTNPSLILQILYWLSSPVWAEMCANRLIMQDVVL